MKFTERPVIPGTVLLVLQSQMLRASLWVPLDPIRSVGFREGTKVSSMGKRNLHSPGEQNSTCGVSSF